MDNMRHAIRRRHIYTCAHTCGPSCDVCYEQMKILEYYGASTMGGKAARARPRQPRSQTKRQASGGEARSERISDDHAHVTFICCKLETNQMAVAEGGTSRYTLSLELMAGRSANKRATGTRPFAAPRASPAPHQSYKLRLPTAALLLQAHRSLRRRRAPPPGWPPPTAPPAGCAPCAG